MSKPIRKRSEVAAEFTWDLTDIFPSDEAWRAEYEALRPYTEAVAAYQGRLGESAETLLAYFRLDDELNVRVGRLYGYANCKADEDTSNGFYQDLRGKALSLSVTLSGAGAFAASELLALSDETLTRFYAEQPELTTYRRPIEQVRRRRAHILSPECEALLANAGEMADSPDAIFGVFHNADLRFPAVTDGAGAEQPLTDATFVPLLQSGDRALRRNAFETYYATLGGYRNTLAATLDAQFKQLRFFANARRYPSTLDAALDATEVPVSVYDSLIESVHANLDKMYRYVALRRRLLGVDELHMYDVYTPIVPDVAEEIPFEQAKATVLDALAVRGLYRHAAQGLRPSLARRVSQRRQARRRVLLRHRAPAPLRSAQPHRRPRQPVHHRARDGPRHAQLSELQASARLHERLRHLRRRGRLDLQRGAAHAASAAQEHRQARAGLSHQSFP